MKRPLATFFWLFFLLTLPFFRLEGAEVPPPIKILIVPGHDKDSWGAQYGNLKEASMNLALATELFNILKKDKRFAVQITQNSSGYTEEFANYLKNEKSAIENFIKVAKERTTEQIAEGTFIEKPNTPHNRASDQTVQKLYGFNKWANDNHMDAVIHVHFNDYKRKTKWAQGDRKGFAIYLPDTEFANSPESYNLANHIFKQLKKKYTTSNYINELGGMVYDQKLIALGANDTLLPSVRSMLIEYGYIYRFGDRAKRLEAYTNMANLTATGIKEYFFPSK